MAFASRINRWFDVKSRSSGSVRRAATARERSRRCRAALQLESFEDRVMLTGLTIQVNTANDVPLGTDQPGLGWDTNNDGEISLRSALGAVNYYGTGDHGDVTSITIDVPTGTYFLTTLGELDLIPNGIAVSIIGTGSEPATINGEQQYRDLEIQAGSTPASITLENLEFALGMANNSGSIGSNVAAGGAILDNSNPLALENVTLINNKAVAAGSFVDAAGGGLYALGAAVSITSSTIDDNTVTGIAGETTMGGGLYESGASLTLTNSTVMGNATQGGFGNAGGGIYATGSNVSVMGSSITFNSAIGGTGAANDPGGAADGGGLYFDDVSNLSHSLSVSNSQFDNNQVTGGAGGSGSGTFGSYVGPFYSYPVGSGKPGQAGGSVEGGGILVNGNLGATTSVTISNSSVDSNSATSGAGGAGATSGFSYLGHVGSYTATGAVGGAAGNLAGAGIEVQAPNGSVQISGSTLSNNTGNGGAGGAGGGAGPGTPGYGDGSADLNAWPGGIGGQGGTVEGVGASISVDNVTVSGTTSSGNIGRGAPEERGESADSPWQLPGMAAQGARGEAAAASSGPVSISPSERSPHYP
jgi:hypothetical protein